MKFIYLVNKYVLFVRYYFRYRIVGCIWGCGNKGSRLSFVFYGVYILVWGNK